MRSSRFGPSEASTAEAANGELAMSETGITFDETMSGPFALGQIDPEAGARAGKAADQALAMHASVTIADLDRFIADPQHLGGLAGSIDFAPFGTGIEATRGVFNLFSPAENHDTHHMVYELGFSHGGKDYYLAGRKIVRDDPGIDLWSDTTTLFTTLHEGGDKNGPIAGAGVLSLGVTDLADLVSTLRVTGTDDGGEKAATVAKFGRFFMGELWERYGP